MIARLAAAIVGVPLFFFLLLADALGDCAPGAVCRHGFLLWVLAPTAIVTAAIYFVTRWLSGLLSKQS